MRRRLALAALLAVCGMLAACATSINLPGPPPGAVPEPTETVAHGPRHATEVEQPGPFLVRYGHTELQLQPMTYCYRNGCVDGFDENPPSVGSPDEIFVFIGTSDFDSLSAGQFNGGDDYCAGRSVESSVANLGDGWWSVTPRGPADDYVVSLSAFGPAGDMFAQVRWLTSADAPLPEPEASLALIADHDGEPDSYGLELSVANLSASPQEYSATITVTAGNGRSLTFDATTSADACAGDGALYFDEPDAEALAASRLGDFPFTYDVELTLDGESHTASATFPDDVIEDHGVAVELVFTPALP